MVYYGLLFSVVSSYIFFFIQCDQLHCAFVLLYIKLTRLIFFPLVLPSGSPLWLIWIWVDRFQPPPNYCRNRNTRSSLLSSAPITTYWTNIIGKLTRLIMHEMYTAYRLVFLITSTSSKLPRFLRWFHPSWWLKVYVQYHNMVLLGQHEPPNP